MNDVRASKVLSPDQADSYTTSDILTYKKYVRSMANAADQTIILNRTPQHAAVIVAALFEKATASVRILTNTLSRNVYATRDVIDAAVSFLKRNDECRIDILTETSIAKDHPFISALRDADLMNRVTLRCIPESVQMGYKFNFALVDKENFRFEKDRSSYEAVVQFGESTIGHRLDNIFSSLARRSETSV